MAYRKWIVKLDDDSHTVELEHGYWSGQRRIRFDGKEIERMQQLLDSGTEHRFTIDNHDFIMRIRPRLFSFEYDLFVDGLLV